MGKLKVQKCTKNWKKCFLFQRIFVLSCIVGFKVKKRVTTVTEGKHGT